MKKVSEAPGLEPFRVEPQDDGLEAFKGWLPTGDDPGITDEDTGRVTLETLRRFIRESAVIHRSTSPGKKYIGRAFKGKTSAERERTIQHTVQSNINTPHDYDSTHLASVEKSRQRIAKHKKKKSETQKHKKKKCDDLHGKCPGHWYAGGISTTPMIGEDDV